MKHLGTKTLHTERLTLRKLTEDDIQGIFDTWASDPLVTTHLTWEAHKTTEDTKRVVDIWVKDYENESTYRWIIEHNEHKQVIGMIDVVLFAQRNECATIGYVLGQKYWSQGFMSEAFKAVIAFLFEEVGIHRIEATHMIDNSGSGKVMEKCGLKLEGTKRLKMKTNEGIFVDLVSYGLVREDYFSNN